jgi:hypothetical protein
MPIATRKPGPQLPSAIATSCFSWLRMVESFQTIMIFPIMRVTKFKSAFIFVHPAIRCMFELFLAESFVDMH